MKDIDPQPDMLDNGQDNNGITGLLGELENLMAVLNPLRQESGDDLGDYPEDTPDSHA